MYQLELIFWHCSVSASFWVDCSSLLTRVARLVPLNLVEKAAFASAPGTLEQKAITGSIFSGYAAVRNMLFLVCNSSVDIGWVGSVSLHGQSKLFTQRCSNKLIILQVNNVQFIVGQNKDQNQAERFAKVSREDSQRFLEHFLKI